jgi:hypothetical protein
MRNQSVITVAIKLARCRDSEFATTDTDQARSRTDHRTEYESNGN